MDNIIVYRRNIIIIIYPIALVKNKMVPKHSIKGMQR